MKKKKIYIYGTGRVAERYLTNLNKNQYEIVGFLDTYKQGTFYDKTIYKLDDVLYQEWDEIHVATIYFDVFKLLLEKHVPKSKIVLCHKKLFEEYFEFSKGACDIKNNFPTVLTVPMTYLRGIEAVSQNMAQWSQDYCRYNTLYLLAEEIRSGKIDGCLAELGVYKGDFAKLMNEEFPERTLYLFDTFEGFDESQKHYDMESGYLTSIAEENSQIKKFSDTNIKTVLDKMIAPAQCIARKGLFPETIPDEEVQYALVSLDCDLYIPILEGLKYFYPRLAIGGYIMLHDYNGTTYQGVKKAVADYEKIIGRMHKVPIPDEAGTLVICK